MSYNVGFPTLESVAVPSVSCYSNYKPQSMHLNVVRDCNVIDNRPRKKTYTVDHSSMLQLGYQIIKGPKVNALEFHELCIERYNEFQPPMMALAPRNWDQNY